MPEKKLMGEHDSLSGEQVLLRLVRPEDCNQVYLSWLNNPDVNQYLETRWQDQSLETIKEFVGSMIKDPYQYLFAIVHNADQKHIGNIKLGPINPFHGYADVSYFIGDGSVWGKGCATEAIALVVEFAFDQLKLNGLQAGVYSGNISSRKALEKNQFTLAGCLDRKLVFRGERQDHLYFWRSNV